jgi:hypothetical protein
MIEVEKVENVESTHIENITSQIENLNIKTSDKPPAKKIPYKEEKAAKALKKMQSLKKADVYRESYKNKESQHKTNQYQANQMQSDKRFELCKNMVLFIQEKIDNKKIEVTLFETSFLKSFIKEFANANDNTNLNNNPHNSHNNTNNDGTCNIGDKCIVWNCRYIHSSSRRSECECIDMACPKLHMRQALCKNPNHDADCKMAHKIQDLN